MCRFFEILFKTDAIMTNEVLQITKKGVSQMFSNIGVPGLILILVLALIVFGPKKLPEIGRAIGQSLREFKNSTKGLIEEEKDKVVEEVKSEQQPKSNEL